MLVCGRSLLCDIIPYNPRGIPTPWGGRGGERGEGERVQEAPYDKSLDNHMTYHRELNATVSINFLVEGWREGEENASLGVHARDSAFEIAGQFSSS